LFTYAYFSPWDARTRMRTDLVTTYRTTLHHTVPPRTAACLLPYRCTGSGEDAHTTCTTLTCPHAAHYAAPRCLHTHTPAAHLPLRLPPRTAPHAAARRTHAAPHHAPRCTHCTARRTCAAATRTAHCLLPRRARTHAALPHLPFPAFFSRLPHTPATTTTCYATAHTPPHHHLTHYATTAYNATRTATRLPRARPAAPHACHLPAYTCNPNTATGAGRVPTAAYRTPPATTDVDREPAVRTAFPTGQRLMADVTYLGGRRYIPPQLVFRHRQQRLRLRCVCATSFELLCASTALVARRCLAFHARRRGVDRRRASNASVAASNRFRSRAACAPMFQFGFNVTCFWRDIWQLQRARAILVLRPQRGLAPNGDGSALAFVAPLDTLRVAGIPKRA